MTAPNLLKILEEFHRAPVDFYEKFPWRNVIYYAEDAFKFMGFETMDSMDFSDYEGATIVHDLNQPVPESLHNRYDVVCDGGTLEHIFNFPMALSNAMRMVKPGGSLILNTPANCQCGHGFYQFSPELFFRAFAPANGFEMVRIYASSKGKFYHVVDPQIVHGRVELRDGAMLLIHATKISDKKPFEVPPQQSDYVSTWKSHEDTAAPQDGRLKKLLREKLSRSQIASISRYLNRLRQAQRVRNWRRSARISNRRFYIPVTDWNVPTRSVTGSSS